MAITLAEAKVGMSDKVDQMVIDEFRRSSVLMDMMTFDDAISSGTGGSTLTYGYVQLSTPSTAAVRAINNEYTANEAKRTKKTADAIVMGGSFQIDRVLQNTSGAINEMNFQLQEKIKAVSNYYHNLLINGAAATSATGYVASTFDGLRKSMAASQTIASSVDVTTSALMDTNANAFIDEISALVAAVEGGADVLLMNSKMLGKVASIARRAGFYSRDKNDFGVMVERFGDIPMINLGGYYNGTATVDVVGTTTPTTSAYGTSSIIAVKLGLDAFHGISPMGGGSGLIHTYLPDLNAPGAVKTGEVELVAGAVLKNTLKAAMLDGVKILPKSAS